MRLAVRPAHPAQLSNADPLTPATAAASPRCAAVARLAVGPGDAGALIGAANDARGPDSMRHARDSFVADQMYWDNGAEVVSMNLAMQVSGSVSDQIE